MIVNETDFYDFIISVTETVLTKKKTWSISHPRPIWSGLDQVTYLQPMQAAGKYTLHGLKFPVAYPINKTRGPKPQRSLSRLMVWK